MAARVRNPLTSFSERVRYINYGRCYYFEPPTLKELDHIDAAAACRYFSESFQNPAEFRLCLTGNLQVLIFTARWKVMTPMNQKPLAWISYSGLSSLRHNDCLAVLGTDTLPICSSQRVYLTCEGLHMDLRDEDC